MDRKEASKNSVHKSETESLKEYPRDWLKWFALEVNLGK